MTVFDRAIARTLPAVPRPVVQRLSRRYIAGSTCGEALDVVRRLNAAGKAATIDVLGESIDESTITYPTSWAAAPRTHGDPAAISEAIALLARAERPLILGGSGVWWSDAAAAFQAFVETTGIPFYTTPISRGTVPEDHELAFLNARAREFSEVDVLLAHRRAVGDDR